MRTANTMGPNPVWRWTLSVILCLLAYGAAGVDEGDWELRPYGGAQVQMPKAWQVQRELPNAIAYGFDSGTGVMLLFGYGWEEDPTIVRAALEEEGMTFAAARTRTLAGIDFLEHEVQGPADSAPAWIRQLVASDSGPDGRFMIIQYGVVGAADPGPYATDLEQVVSSLTITSEASSSDVVQVGGDATEPDPDPGAQAQAIFKEIVALDDQDLGAIETLYLRVIDDFPTTKQAQESYWRLANLYLQAYDPPREADTVALLERYLAAYPGSTQLEERFPMFVTPGIGLVQQRLLRLYEEAGDLQKALPIYQGLLADPEAITEEQLPYVPGYADLLERSGRDAEALSWYQLYVARAADPDDFVVRIAREAIERLSGTTPDTDDNAAQEAKTPDADPEPETTAAGGIPAGPTDRPVEPSPAPEPTATTKGPAAVPNAAPATPPNSDTDADALATEGRALLATGDYAGALERLRASIAIKPDAKLTDRIKKLEAYLGAPPPRQ